MGYKVGLTGAACDDLGAAVRFLAEKSPEAALRLGNDPALQTDRASDRSMTRRMARIHHVPRGNDLTVCEEPLRE